MEKQLELVPFQEKNILLDYQIRWERSLKEYYHWHPYCEFLFVHEGQGTIILNGHGYEIRRGMLFFFQPFQLHRVHPLATPQTPYVRSIFYADPLLMERLLRPFPKRHDLFSSLWHREHPDNVFDFSGRTEKVEWIYSGFQRDYPGNARDDEELTLFFLQLLNEIRFLFSNGGSSDLPTRAGTARYSEAIMQWIENHYVEDVTLKKLADVTHLSTSYVSRVFRRETGSRITDYLTARRIKEACTLLETTDFPVEQIGTRVGVANTSYFIQLFRNSIGMTPLQYRSGRGKESR
jgi:AraC-like DNA-binding protein